MLRALRRAGYSEPTSIQAQVIPPALESMDIVGQARTGTGKTAAFGIPILEMLDPLSDTRYPQALVLVPTRELAEQVHQEIVKLAYGCPTASVVMAGGKHMRQQIDALARGVQLVVGTPGRVLDHIGRRTMRLDDIWCVVLDEADRMLDIGFRPAIERILRACPTDRQTMLLSATMPPAIEKLSERYLQDPVRINCSQSQVSGDTIEQRYFTVRQDDKFPTLLALLKRETPRQVIIFCRTKRGTDRLHRAIKMESHRMPELASMRMACIHGDMNQRDRDRVFTSLRAGELNLLVATDVVGRGIDVSTVSHIINYDIPLDCDDYVHRVGRTGRMGREGIAFTFVTNSEGPQLTAIELNINRLLIRDSLTGESPASRGEGNATRAEAPTLTEPIFAEPIDSGRTEGGRTDSGRVDGHRTLSDRTDNGRAGSDRTDNGRTDNDRAPSPVVEDELTQIPKALAEFNAGVENAVAQAEQSISFRTESASAEAKPRRRKLFPMKRRTNERLAKLSTNREE